MNDINMEHLKHEHSWHNFVVIRCFDIHGFILNIKEWTGNCSQCYFKTCSTSNCFTWFSISTESLEKVCQRKWMILQYWKAIVTWGVDLKGFYLVLSGSLFNSSQIIPFCIQPSNCWKLKCAAIWRNAQWYL